MELKLLNRSSCLIYIPFYNLGHGHIHINLVQHIYLYSDTKDPILDNIGSLVIPSNQGTEVTALFCP